MTASSRPPGVELRAVTVRRPDGSLVLPGLELQLAAGSLTVLCGPNGAGKSTIAQLCAGLIPRSVPARVDGEVLIAGESTLAAPAQRLCHLVASVLQNPDAQLCCRTVREELRLGPQLLGLPPSEVERRASAAAGLIGLELDPEHDPAHLSGGQRQLLALAAALTMETPLLVLDEATSRLDGKYSQRVTQALERVRRERGTTILAVEHRLELHLRGATRLLVLGPDGRIALDGQPQELVERNREQLIQLGVRLPDRKRTASPPSPDTATPGLMLDRLSVRRGRTTLLHDISADFPAGAAIALLGGNGAGKSTLLEALAGSAHRGRWRLGQQARRRVRTGFTPQRPELAFLTPQLRQELQIGIPRRHRRERLRAGLRLLRAAGLRGSARRHPLRLSAGQQQRLGVLLALLPAADGAGMELLLFDEPTSAQDARGEQLIGHLIDTRPSGSTAVFATHDTGFAAAHATHALHLRAGRILAHGPVGEVLGKQTGKRERP